MRPLTTKNLIKYLYFKADHALQVDLIESKKDGKNESLETFQVLHRTNDNKYTSQIVELHIIDSYTSDKEPVLKSTYSNERLIDLDTYEKLVSYELQHIVINKKEDAKITTSGDNLFSYDIESSAGFPFMNDHYIKITESDITELDKPPIKDLPSAVEELKKCELINETHHEDYVKINEFLQKFAEYVDSGTNDETELENLQSEVASIDNKKYIEGNGGIKVFNKAFEAIQKVRKNIYKLTECQFTDTGEELRTRVIIGHDGAYKHKV